MLPAKHFVEVRDGAFTLYDDAVFVTATAYPIPRYSMYDPVPKRFAEIHTQAAFSIGDPTKPYPFFIVKRTQVDDEECVGLTELREKLDDHHSRVRSSTIRSSTPTSSSLGKRGQSLSGSGDTINFTINIAGANTTADVRVGHEGHPRVGLLC